MTHIYLAILKDRHIDNEYKAFNHLADAVNQCTEWAADYKEEFREPTSWKYKPHWEFYIETESDEGPKIMVQKIELI